MSKDKKRQEDWWLYVKRIVCSYPEILKEERELAGSISSPFTGTRRKSRMQNEVFELERNKKRRLDAVEYAIFETRKLPDANARLTVIKLVLFDGTHNLAGAAMKAGCAEITAGRWQAKFLRMVAEYLDLP
ncbi:MAG: hypothetical protein IJC39_03230 [Firmicutes bacterium]|nr:hypothetical protein [Bacillota bacterium]